RRRIRIMAGNLQQLREFGKLLHPLRPLPMLFFFSHKIVRLMVPFAMPVAFVANLFLLGNGCYRSVFVTQLAFYTVAILGTVCPLRPRALMLPFYFCMANTAAFFGLYHALTR